MDIEIYAISAKMDHMGWLTFWGSAKWRIDMPTKEFDKGKLFFGNDEVGFRPLGELSQIELDENCETSEDIPFLDIGGEYEFTAEIQPPERMTVRDMNLVLFGFNVEKLKQNNWRKMHGIPMRRRLKRK